MSNGPFSIIPYYWIIITNASVSSTLILQYIPVHYISYTAHCFVSEKQVTPNVALEPIIDYFASPEGPITSIYLLLGGFNWMTDREAILRQPRWLPLMWNLLLKPPLRQ